MMFSQVEKESQLGLTSGTDWLLNNWDVPQLDC